MSDLQSDALALADRILVLNNAQLRTPTREEIAEAICLDAIERFKREALPERKGPILTGKMVDEASEQWFEPQTPAQRFANDPAHPRPR